MSDAEDNSKTGDRENKDSKDKSKEDGGHLDNQVIVMAEDGKDDSGKPKDKVTPNKRNAKTKNQKKEEKSDVKEEEEEEEEEDDDDDEDEDDDDDDNDEEDGENDTNGKVPLLDQPLQISGTRDRKKVQRFSEEFKPVPKESPKNEIPEGRGQQLGDIPRIESIIQKFSTEKLKPLYRLLFNRPGKPALMKRYIRKFNGFDFKDGSDQYVRKRASIIKLDMASLKDLSRTLDLTVGGSREDIVNRLLEFLMEPKDSDRPAPKESKKKKSSSSTSKKIKRKSNSSGKGKKKKADSEDEDESSEGELEIDDEKSSSEEAEKKDSTDEKEESEEDTKKRKPSKKKPAANSKKPAPKKADQKKETENKKVEVKVTEKKKRKETEVKSDDESSEDEPLVKKTKQPPTDDEIKSYVKQILEGANLEEITMKTVCKQVYAAYPEFDLAHKKDFIKTTVKSLIST